MTRIRNAWRSWRWRRWDRRRPPVHFGEFDHYVITDANGNTTEYRP